MSELKNQISQFIDTNAKNYQDISLAIHAKPEVSDFEYFASQTLSEQLKKEGFEIELPAAGHRTGFAATYKSNKPGPTVAFLAEYDALAGLGHGCGHNVFGATSSLAGAALKSVVDQIGGEVRVYGTPGEEGGQNGSAKGSFVKKGYLNDVDFALCVHPGSGPEDGLSTRNYACAPVDIEFWGKPAHAAGCPQDGINALDAQILTYAAVGVLRQQLTDRIRIHGVIVDGGKFDWEASGKFDSLTKPNPSYHGISFTQACGAAAFVTKVRAILLRDTGATLSPFNAFLFLQGLETLSLRVERHTYNALKVVEYLNNHPQVESVSHPSVSTDPKQQELYKKYFPNGGGSIFTFDIKGDAQKAKDFIDNLELFSLLANVADVKSLVIHPATTTHSQCTEEELLDQGIRPNTIRLSIGCENIDDIIQDLDEAFKAIA